MENQIKLQRKQDNLTLVSSAKVALSHSKIRLHEHSRHILFRGYTIKTSYELADFTNQIKTIAIFLRLCDNEITFLPSIPLIAFQLCERLKLSYCMS